MHIGNIYEVTVEMVSVAEDLLAGDDYAFHLVHNVRHIGMIS